MRWHVWWRIKMLAGFWREKPARKRLLGRSRRRWEDTNKMFPERMRWEGVGWTFLTLGYGKLAGCCECGDEHLCFITIKGNS
jgi:hypothetical protein